MVKDWSIYPNFSEREFACKHSGICLVRHELVDLLQSMRSELKQPIFISSGYRSPSHPVEAMKEKPGEHTHGMAADIICHGQRALVLIEMALRRGVTRLGVHQKGLPMSGRFIHIGLGDQLSNQFQSGIWTY